MFTNTFLFGFLSLKKSISITHIHSFLPVLPCSLCCSVVASFLQVVANVHLNLRHQRRDGDERAAQRLGSQDAFELFELAGVAGVDFGVLHRVLRVLQRSFHVGVDGFGRAAADFRYKRVLPRRLVHVLNQWQWFPQRGFILQAQLGQIDGRHDLDCNGQGLNLLVGF